MSALAFDIVTIFPDFFSGPFSHGIVKQAQKKDKITIHIVDLRAFTIDRHKTVDDRPFGGGEGMVLKAEPLFRAVESLHADTASPDTKVILLSPQGRKFNQSIAFELSGYRRIILLCGRYEGVDERVSQYLANDEISIGDYVLSGGELAACVLVDAVTRLIPGVLNNKTSIFNESFTGDLFQSGDCPVLDHPQYTRPEEFKGLRVPEILLSGNHSKVSLWRRKRALEKTLKNRPDLLQYESLSEQDKKLLVTEIDS